MESIFHYESGLIKLLNRMANLLIVSVLWSICCIPVITIVPASAAMYHTVSKIVQGTGQGVIKDYLRTLKGEWKQGCLLTLLSLFSAVIVLVCVFFGLQVRNTVPGMAYFVLACVLAFLWTGIVLYIPVVQSRYQANLVTLLRIAVYLVLQRPIRTVFMMAGVVIIAVMSVYFPVFLFVCPGIYMDIFCSSIEKSLANVVPGTNEGDGIPSGDTEENFTDTELSARKLDEMMQTNAN